MKSFRSVPQIWHQFPSLLRCQRWGLCWDVVSMFVRTSAWIIHPCCVHVYPKKSPRYNQFLPSWEKRSGLGEPSSCAVHWAAQSIFPLLAGVTHTGLLSGALYFKLAGKLMYHLATIRLLSCHCNFASTITTAHFMWKKVSVWFSLPRFHFHLIAVDVWSIFNNRCI